MPILSFNNIPYQVYRHYRMITESNPLVSFGKHVEFNNSEEGKIGVWSSWLIFPRNELFRRLEELLRANNQKMRNYLGEELPLRVSILTW